MSVVSIVIRTTGVGIKLRTLACTLRSILNQSFKNFEIIIVTSSNKQNILNVVRDIASNYLDRIKILEVSIRNRCIQSNIGILASRGKYIAVFDDDVLLERDLLRILVKVLESLPPKVACICAPVMSFYSMEKISNYKITRSCSEVSTLLVKIAQFLKRISLSSTFWREGTLRITEHFYVLPTIPSNCFVCRREAILRIGLYDASLKEPLRGDDYDLGFKLRASGYIILGCHLAKAYHLENYRLKWSYMSPNSFKQLTLTEFYVLSKYTGLVGLSNILLHALYRLVESAWLATLVRSLSVILNVVIGCILGLIRGFLNRIL